MITIITPTYCKNKLPYLKEAAHAVIHQTTKDWQWWIILDGADPEVEKYCRWLQRQDNRILVFVEPVEDRWQYYRPAVLLNKYLPTVTTEYVFSLADDDLPTRDGLQILRSALDANPGIMACYGRFEMYHKEGPYWRINEVKPPGDLHIYGPDNPKAVFWKLDWNQVLMRTQAIHTMYNMGARFTASWVRHPETGGHISDCDAQFLHWFCQMYQIVPCDRVILWRRKTPYSMGS